jgi:YVTN family beta-propeller protein
MKLDIIGNGYTGRSLNVNASRSVNFYPEIGADEDKAVSSLVGTPGTSLFVNTGLGIIRGMHSFNGLLYFVAGGKLYSVNAAGTVSAQLGSDLVTSTGRVVMADNGLAPTGGNELAITDGQKIYIWDVDSSTFTTNAITAFTIAFIGGYFVADIGGGRFQTSNLYDGTTWDGGDVSTADSSPDDLLAVVNNHGEAWYQSVGSPPFSRMSGGVIDYGCAARYSIAKGNNTLFWLGTKRNNDQGEFIGVCMANGYNAEIISPPTINYQIDRYSTISDAFAYFYTEEGHEFYVLTFPTANATWVYDTTTGFWHERSFYINNPYVIGRHIGNSYAYFNNKHYVGDYRNGKLYEMASTFLSDAGEPIASVRTFPHLSDGDNLYNQFIHKFQIDMEAGVGDGSASTLQEEVIKTITVGDQPYGITTNDTYVWIPNVGDGTVSKINVVSNAIETTITVGNSPIQIHHFGGYVYVSNFSDGTVSKIDASSDTVDATITVGSQPFGITDDGTFIWVVNSGSSNIMKINTSTNSVVDTITVGTLPQQAVANATYVWVTNRGSATVSKVKIATSSIETTINVGTTPIGIASDTTNLWVANGTSKTISKILIATDTVINTITVPNTPGFIDSFLSYIWVTNVADGTVMRINPTTNLYEAKIDVGTTPYGIIGENNNLWISNNGSDNTSKIQVYRDSNDADPTAALSWSNDGGHLWSNEHFSKIGKEGEYIKRLIWRRLGSSRDKVFRVAISDAVKKVLISSYVESTGGVS